jgi:hypothetical protein
MKTKPITRVLSLISLLLFSINISAQQIEVKGIVTDFNGEALKASITVKSSKLKIETDSTGIFRFFCKKNSKIKVTSKGFAAENLKIKDNSFQYIKMKVSGDNYSIYPNFDDIIRMKFAGVVEFNGGQLNLANRGGSFGDMYLELDEAGVSLAELQSLSTSKIKSVRVIRGTETLMYGDKGQYGVLKVATFK